MIFIGLAWAACVCVLVLSCTTQSRLARDDAQSKDSVASPPQPAVSAPAAQVNESLPPVASEQAQTPPATMAQWATDAESDDAKTRAAAIVALASAPSSEAVPVLARVLRVGSPQDRQLALGSLRALAQEQGDADGVIRNVLRQTLYHSDDQDITLGAQAALDAIDATETKP